MSECHWEPSRSGDGWVLVNPLNTTYKGQLSKYRATKAILFTCRQWYHVGYHLLFRFLFLLDPSKLPSLCFALDRNASLGCLPEIENILVSIIHQCPNLENFTIDWPITPSFLPIADALCTFSAQSLRSIHWSLSPAALPRLIWTLDSLPSLMSAFINFEPSSDSNDQVDKTLLLGSASSLSLVLPSLEQLLLRGFSSDFVDQLIGWSLPALKSFSLDFIAQRHDLPDVLEFLKYHGSSLTFLDLNTIPAIDLSSILDFCPVLTTFCFNPDWRLPFHAEVNSQNPGAPQPTLLRSSHAHITHIGLHQLLHAFTPSITRGLNPLLTPVATYMIQRTNDLTFGQLTRQFFPSLKVIRVLNRVLLRELEKNNGPENVGGCFARWEWWEEQCRREDVRLEDCTGALLGELPEDEEESESDSDESEVQFKPANALELKQLLEECRKMTMTRQEPMMFSPPPMRWQ
ncbi:hypothetical protein EW146_g7111 [Bondarzewia mesenterica]|uniref:Uncharacterized protein n=1 Tax=Bondarzewia mesenterica TaxID=1095465 RepID=A0A4S4LLP2_9AGAM|nr:hypothetical protein EW146_g7111 [Bondarzewia mesenterica]